MKVEIVTGDLLNQDVKIIVNAWNRNLIPWWLLWPHGGTAPFRDVMRYE